MALGSPAWSALVAEIVSIEQVADAVTLNAVAFNVARAIGPAIGGVILAASGATATFLLNACSFGGVIVALLVIRPRQGSSSARVPPPPVARAFAEPVMHIVRDAGLHSVFAVMVLFTAGASFVYVL